MRSIVLASASPRRADLLRQIGLPFRVRAVDLDETPEPDEAPDRYVERLARAKAMAGLAHHRQALVIGADTTVVGDDGMLAKPVDAAQAHAMLTSLSGRSHRVMTAVALAGEHGCFARLVTTEVRFRALSNDEIAAYCQTGEPLDKAGGYGIQGRGGVFVERLWGSYSGVVGLPLEETAMLLAQAGAPVWQHWCKPEERRQ